jgi:PAS domain S-box-containing protein
MTRSLQVLIVEDNPADAELVTRELRRAGFAIVSERVDTEAGFSASLRPDLDIILSDYSMPQFSGLLALEMLQKSGLDIPFIIISGTIGEDTAVAAMKLGAADYLLKDRLVRLGPAIHQAIEQARLRSERKLSECALTLFRTLVDRSSDTIEVIDPQTGRFLDVNEKGPAELGLTRAEYLARRVTDIDTTLSEADWPQLVTKIHAAGSVSGQGSHRRKDGTSFPVEFNASWVSLDRDYIVTIVRDVTRRQQSEERYRRLVDSNAQGVVFRKTNGEITGANDAFLQLVGYSRDDLEAGRLNAIALTPPEFTGLDRHCLDEMAATGVCTPYEKEFLRMDGSRVAVLVGAAAFEYNPDEGVCFVLDLTERKKLEQQFLRAQRMESIGVVAGGVAHDLNNVLSPIIMALELLKLKFADADSQKLLSLVEASAHRGAEMVRQVLSFARGADGRRIDVQIPHLIEEMKTIAIETFPQGIEVRSVVAHDLRAVAGDPTQLHQVVLNLCVNARDAMPDGGTLTLAAENLTLDARGAAVDFDVKPGQYVLLKVEDTGSGILPEILGEIFDPFFTTKEVGRGTGLGLSTTRAIVKSHGGSIQVESEPGRGTRFKILLPAWTGDLSASTAGDAGTMPHGRGELVLVVDDDTSVRRITGQTLEAFGYRAVLAADGKEAVAIYASRGTEIAVVLTDMTMPGMDGPATIQVLRKINPAVRIIATSGLATDGHRGLAADNGVRQFLAKPYTAETLLVTVKQVLEMNG